MTLIEVMVVLLIMALTTALAMGSIRSRHESDHELDRLALVVDAAAERARTRGTPIRFEPIRHGYRFSRLETDGKWVAVVDDPMLGERALPTDMVFQRLTQDGQDVAEGLVFGSDVTLFSIEVMSGSGLTTLVGQVSGILKMTTGESGL